MIDKSVPYKDIAMKMAFEDVHKIAVPALLKPYSYSFYQDGDQAHWARIMDEVNEFDTLASAEDHFAKEFLPHSQDLKERMVFIQDARGLPVATATAWHTRIAGGRVALLHWVSACPAHQGKGLGKAAVCKAMSLFPALEPEREIYLHTQTWSHKAVWLYASLGFRMIRQEDEKNQYTEAMEVLKSVLPPKIYSGLEENAV